MRRAVVKRGKTYSFVLPLERDPDAGRKRQEWVGGFTTKKACEAAVPLVPPVGLVDTPAAAQAYSATARAPRIRAEADRHHR